MSRKNLDQRAFPCPEDESWVRTHGMTLRHYFAAAALTGLLSVDTGVVTKADMVEAAYDYAELMLKEGDKRE